ncbi:MAG: NAD-binding protein, partial [Bacteroidota bacterium]
FLSVSVLSMAATPLVIWLATRFADRTNRWPLPDFLRYGLIPRPESLIAKVREHIVIVGYGLNGRNVARAARFAGIPYAIIDINPDTVRSERNKGEIIHYGDAGHKDILSHANTEEAMILVSTLPTTGDNNRIIRAAKKLNHKIHIIIRTRFIRDMKTLFDTGADEVIPEEFETSIEIFTKVLTKYSIPQEEIEKLVTEIRSDGYHILCEQDKDCEMDTPDPEK